MTALPSLGSRSTRRLLLFASGDFACNLYWQSTVFYLLFFYTDVLHLAPLLAGGIVMIGAVWDGLADLGAGMMVQRGRRRPGRLIVAGTVPLGVSFVLLYAAPATNGAIALATLIAFRACYAVVNVSYAAWTVRVVRTSDDRALVSGLRMMFGTLAAVVVAAVTQALAGRGGRLSDAHGFLVCAALFALVASANLLAVAAGMGRDPDDRDDRIALALPVAAALARLLRHRAYIALNAAAAASTIGGTLLGRSVLYYCGDVLGDPGAGSRSLMIMGVAGAAAIPGWMLVARRWGNRRTWLAAAMLLLTGGALLAADPHNGLHAELFFAGAQAAMTAFSFVFWAMLPDTIAPDDSVARPGVEGIAYGLAALLQKVAGGIAAGLFGFAYQVTGYHDGATTSTLTHAGIGWTMIGGSALFVAVSMPLIATVRIRREAGLRPV